MKQLLLAGLILFSVTAFSQADSTDTDKKKKEEVKKGWNFAPLPIVGYDADMGFQFGLLCQVFNYGDGSSYPDYKYTLYAEASWYTKGTSIYQLFFDSKNLLPNNLRLTADFAYMGDNSFDFYGFNGYQAAYHPEFEDEESPEYKSRMYYRMSRKLFRTVADLQGKFFKPAIRWIVGINYFNYSIETVDIERINKGKNEADQLPDVDLLYDEYVDYEIIKEDEKDGGNTLYLKAGLIFDTRNFEAAPSRGIWSEALVLVGPTWNSAASGMVSKIVLIHRQYIPLAKDKLVFAYRLGYQTTLGSTAPFFLQSYMLNSFARTTRPDGLGGSKTPRGVLRARIVGDGFAYGSVELRIKVISFQWIKQNFYVGINLFGDAGMVTKEHPVDMTSVPLDEYSDYFDQDHDSMHFSFGAGLRLAMNQNFIVALDYGIAADKRDGNSGFYLGLGHLF